MKSKLLVIAAMIALVGFVVTLDYGKVWAEVNADPELPEPFDPAKSFENAAFSNILDRMAVPGGGSIDGWDALQVLFTGHLRDQAGPPFPQDDVDYDGVDEGIGDQVDALANVLDAKFGQLISNKANLLVSFATSGGEDPSCTGIPGWGRIAVFIEVTGGGTNPKWTQYNFNYPNTPPDTQLIDLDGLQLWGGPVLWANMHSEQGEPGIGNPPQEYSVFFQQGNDPSSRTGYVPHSDIVNAVRTLGCDADTFDIDLDAVMVKDANINTTWDTGDTIIFSIRDTGPLGGNWDGGEIVVLPYIGQPGSAFFLNHGGHLWNTAFNVAETFNLDPPTEEVNGIEAYPVWYQQTPTLTQWGLIILVALVVVSTIFVMLRRRKAAVPA